MADDDIQLVVRDAMLALLDSKPDDPLAFLAKHFQRECEKSNKVAQAAHLLTDTKIHHPAVEELLHRAYHIISQYQCTHTLPGKEEVHGLTGDIYTDLLTQLTSWLPEPYHERLLQKLKCHATEYVPFPIFRQGTLTCLLLREFVQEVRALFKDLDLTSKGSATKSLCDAALAHLCTALSATSHDPSSVLEVGFGFSTPLLAKTLVQEVASDDTTIMREEEFVQGAIDVFLSQISDLPFCK